MIPADVIAEIEKAAEIYMHHYVIQCDARNLSASQDVNSAYKNGYTDGFKLAQLRAQGLVEALEHYAKCNAENTSFHLDIGALAREALDKYKNEK